MISSYRNGCCTHRIRRNTYVIRYFERGVRETSPVRSMLIRASRPIRTEGYNVTVDFLWMNFPIVTNSDMWSDCI
jgi:hypothetical protein